MHIYISYILYSRLFLKYVVYVYIYKIKSVIFIYEKKKIGLFYSGDRRPSLSAVEDDPEAKLLIGYRESLTTQNTMYLQTSSKDGR